MNEEEKTPAESESSSESPDSSAGASGKQAVAEFVNRVRSALRGLWERRTQPAVFLPAAGVVLLLLGGVTAVALDPDYRLKEDLQWLAETVPREGTDLYIEVREPAKLYALWKGSETGSAVMKTNAYEALIGGRLGGLQTLFYLLELKAGFSFDQPFDFFEESVGVALAGESTLLVAKMDLSSRLGVALVQAMQTKTIHLPGESLVDEKGNRKEEKPAKDNENEQHYGGENHVPESLPVLVERREELKNLELTVLQSGSRKYYLVLLEDHLFIADDIQLLRDSLSLATGLWAESIGKAAGMEVARKSLGRGDGRALVFINAEGGSFAAPVARLLGGDVGVAAVLRAEEDETMSLDTFAVGGGAIFAGEPGGEGWKDALSFLPADAAVTVLFREHTPQRLLETLAGGSGASAVLGGKLTEFLKGGGMSAGDFDQPGLALVWRGFREERKRMLPQVAAGVRGEDTDVLKLREVVFRKRSEATREFQGVSYLVAKGGKYFHPSRVYFGTGQGVAPGFLATDETMLLDVINARKGNSADLSDLPTHDALDEFQDAPVQIVVNVPLLRDALRDFYLLGALRDGTYSEATIKRDIEPFLAPFAAYSHLHLAHGMAGPVHGRAVLVRP